MVKIKVVYYSLNGHTRSLAEAVCEGAREVRGAEVSLLRVPEIFTTRPPAKTAGRKMPSSNGNTTIVEPEDLIDADAIIFGAPSRFGNVCAPMRAFLESCSALWSEHALVGKIGSAFTTSSTQHGGQEATLIGFYVTLLHLGMVIVGVPYNELRLSTMTEITGGTPYGSASISGASGSRMPSENELAIARSQGRHVAGIAKKMVTAARH